MSSFDSIIKDFKKYPPLIYDLTSSESTNILDSSYDVKLSNNVSYPELTLGFQHFIHRAKDKMELTEKYVNRKKIYLVTSLFEKNIDHKEETSDGTPFTSINEGVELFIKEINPKLPPLMNRAFLKLWEMIVFFNLIPDNEVFNSAHLAEGPGSFIQATIYFREMQEKLGKIKSAAKDNYYGVTLHSDHEHLLMQKEFIKFFDKEKTTRLHVLETKSIKEIKDMYGGNRRDQEAALVTNGDLTKINTIRLFGGSKDIDGFVKTPVDLVTADGGFDWKRENLQEQEAYRLIFSEIVTAIKVQKNGGNFVLKIFESYTPTTIKMIELLRAFYKEVYICKPYTSRISNSEKYIVSKNFDKSKATQSVIKKLEEFIVTLNKNESFNIIDIFTDFKLSRRKIDEYKNINIELMCKQYLGINNIVLFDNLDNKNGIEYNEFLDKQINASAFWNDLFLDTSNFSKLNKYVKSYDYFKLKHDIDNSEYNKEKNNNETMPKEEVEALAISGLQKGLENEEEQLQNTQTKKLSRSVSTGVSKESKDKTKTMKKKINRSEKDKEVNKEVNKEVKKSSDKTTKKKKVSRSSQKGGRDDLNINYDSDIKSVDSYDPKDLGKLDSDDEFIDLNMQL